MGHSGDTATVEHSDGAFSMKMTAKPASINKHRDFVTTEGLFEPQKSTFDHISEALFGTTKGEWEKESR